MRSALALAASLALAAPPSVAADGAGEPRGGADDRSGWTAQDEGSRTYEASLVAWALAVHEPSAGDAPDLRRAWERARDFYEARDREPAWLDERGIAAADEIAARMRTAGEEGLDPAAYDATARAGELHRRRGGTAPGEAAARVDADVRFTVAAFRFASDLALGRWGGAASVRSLPLIEILSGARDAASAREALERLEPVHPEYRALREQLKIYRNIAAKGGWPSLPAELRLEPGRRAATTPAPPSVSRAGIARVRARLAAEGDLADTSLASSPSYDATLQAAVRRARARFGLPPGHALDRDTVEALNVSAEARVRQIAAAMERWRRLPQELGRRHLRVNTPDYTLRFVVDGQPRGAMRVVVGEPETPTPVLSDAISYLEFRPYWNVPESIALEMVPKIVQDPGYLAARRLEVVRGWDEPATVIPPDKVPWRTLTYSMLPYRLRQAPGGHNALGLVKFMFPNVHSVYLHDTPEREKFQRRARAFSNGCVRVEHPVRVAEFLVDGDARWPRAAIVKAMRTGGRKVVDLETPVPVHLTYFTAWVEDGQVHFRPDVYGWDRAEARVPPAMPSP